MRHLAVLTARELRAHAPAAGIAAIAALLPWIAPLLPGISRHSAADVRQATAAVVAALLGLGLAVLAGSGLVSRDLAEGRLGFFLTLPVKSTTVWAARLLAGCALVYGALAVVLLPAYGSLAGLGIQEDAVLWGLPLPWQSKLVVQSLPAVGLVLLPFVLLLVTHQLSVALRARTPWLLLEVLVYAGALLAASAAASRLVGHRAWVELRVASAAGLAIAVATLVVGGALALARGGALLTRFHRVQALTATAGLLLAALAMTGYAAWAVSPGLDAVHAVTAAVAAPQGDWVAAVVQLAGRPSYTPWVLYNHRTGGWLPLSTGWAGAWRSSHGPVTFTGDGRAAVFLRPQPYPGESQDLVWVDLSGERPRLADTLLQVPYGGEVALSADGSAIGVRGTDSLFVATDGGRRIAASARLPPWTHSLQEAVCFVGPNLRHVRLAMDGEVLRLEIRELDPASRRLHVAPAVALPAADGAFLTFSPSGERLLVVRGAGGAATLHDGASGTQLAEVSPAAPFGGMRRATFLADGRLFVPLLTAEGKLVLRLLSADGALLREVPVGSGRGALAVGEWRPDVVLVSIRDRATAGGWQLREVDFSTGQVRPIADRLLPTAPGLAAWDPKPLAGAGKPVLMWDAERSALVSLEPGGRPMTLLPRSSS